MKYRNFGKLDFMVSALGFGAMRLPTEGKDGRISEPEAIRMIRHAIDNGVNYIDTAYPYHSGESEIVCGKALKDGYRDRVALATKSPTWMIKNAEDFDRILDEQLVKLQTDCIDFYLLHSLSRNSWKNVILKLDIIKHAESALQAGKIKHLGFSFHDEASAFMEIVDGYDKWEFCQIQHNYMNTEVQAGTAGLKYAASKGLAVIIMEPLLGGKLANAPKDVRAIFDENAVKHAPAEWAFQWLWNQPEVAVVLSGMNNMQQVEENLVSAGRSGIGLLGAAELDIIKRVQMKYNERVAIPCTACRYCMPCPNNINIPGNFELYNNSIVYVDEDGSRKIYNNFFQKDTRAGECVQCRICEEKCPQKLPISELMLKVHQKLQV